MWEIILAVYGIGALLTSVAFLGVWMADDPTDQTNLRASLLIGLLWPVVVPALFVSLIVKKIL